MPRCKCWGDSGEDVNKAEAARDSNLNPPQVNNSMKLQEERADSQAIPSGEDGQEHQGDLRCNPLQWRRIPIARSRSCKSSIVSSGRGSNMSSVQSSRSAEMTAKEEGKQESGGDEEGRDTTRRVEEDEGERKSNQERKETEDLLSSECEEWSVRIPSPNKLEEQALRSEGSEPEEDETSMSLTQVSPSPSLLRSFVWSDVKPLDQSAPA
eukprot:724840-Hanusia_phi.AAC.3